MSICSRVTVKMKPLVPRDSAGLESRGPRPRDPSTLLGALLPPGSVAWLMTRGALGALPARVSASAAAVVLFVTACVLSLTRGAIRERGWLL